MKEKKNTIIIICIFAAVLIIASVVYNYFFKEGFTPKPTLQALNTETNPPQSETIETAEPSETVNTETEEAPTDTQPSEPIKAANLKLYDIDQKEIMFESFEGKPTVINFWASWCPPCKEEMPEFERVYKQIGDEVNFVMVDLVSSQGETMESGSKFIEKAGYTFPVYYDLYQEAAMTYGISSIPSTIFVDKNGYLVAGVVGAINEETLLNGIEMSIEAGNKEIEESDYVKITQEEAKNIMDSSEEETIILDVRTEEEYEEAHIENALLIPLDELVDTVNEKIPNKDTLIVVYCRSGHGSRAATEVLTTELGYTNVKDFGGINDWIYGTVKGK